MPDAPTNLTTVGGDGQVVLTWEAPASNGGAEISDYEYRINGQEPLDLHRFHRHHPYGHRPRQRHGIHLSRCGRSTKIGTGRASQPNRGDAGSAGSVHPGLCAFRQRGWHHIRSGVRECGNPSNPARPLLSTTPKAQLDGRRIDGGGHGQSGDPRGRRPDASRRRWSRWANSRFRPTAKGSW